MAELGIYLVKQKNLTGGEYSHFVCTASCFLQASLIHPDMDGDTQADTPLHWYLLKNTEAQFDWCSPLDVDVIKIGDYNGGVNQFYCDGTLQPHPYVLAAQYIDGDLWGAYNRLAS